jgi:hypothetical protein
MNHIQRDYVTYSKTSPGTSQGNRAEESQLYEKKRPVNLAVKGGKEILWRLSSTCKAVAIA